MKSPLSRLLLPLVAICLWAEGAAANVPPQASAAQNSATVVAQVLAGIEPAAGDPRIDRLVASAEWRAHRDWVQARWAEVRLRLASMSRWRESSLSLADCDRRTLIYPFSGPDFANAYVLFPRCKTYVLFGLETATGVWNSAAAQTSRAKKFRSRRRKRMLMAREARRRGWDGWLRGCRAAYAARGRSPGSAGRSSV